VSLQVDQEATVGTSLLVTGPINGLGISAGPVPMAPGVGQISGVSLHLPGILGPFANDAAAAAALVSVGQVYYRNVGGTYTLFTRLV
jgi:hypothetical protein